MERTFNIINQTDCVYNFHKIITTGSDSISAEIKNVARCLMNGGNFEEAIELVRLHDLSENELHLKKVCIMWYLYGKIVRVYEIL